MPFKDYIELEKEYYRNRKKMLKYLLTLKVLTKNGLKKYIKLKNRNERIKTLFEDHGVKL